MTIQGNPGLRPLATHRVRTKPRIQGQKTVLLVQDGLDPNFATPHGCEGLGMIARNRESTDTLGVHMHTTLAGADGTGDGEEKK